MGDLTQSWSIAEGTLAAAAGGDADALARIVRTYHDDMARVCFVICGDQDLAQDAAQSAWPKAWRKLGTLRDPARLRPWLVSIAVNEARQAMRRQHRVPVVAEIPSGAVAPAASDPSTNAELLDLARALRIARSGRPRAPCAPLRRRLRRHRTRSGAGPVPVRRAQSARPPPRPSPIGARR